jgi:hypothetical protein
MATHQANNLNFVLETIKNIGKRWD